MRPLSPGDPGPGAFATLRRLIDEARRANPDRERVRQAQTAADRFMTAMVGDRPGFEAAARALYAGDSQLFRRHSGEWPEDIRAYALPSPRPPSAMTRAGRWAGSDSRFLGSAERPG